MACAKPAGLTGGPKDEQSPKLIFGDFKNRTTNFNEDKIVLEFDEWVKLSNPSQNISISPLLETKPTFVLKGKKLVIDLKKTTLDSNTTYVFDLSRSITDLTEGNELENGTIVFSTGEKLDSCKIIGSIKRMDGNETLSNIDVLIYKAEAFEDSSSVFKEKPLYLGKTNAKGSYEINNIKAGNYTVVSVLNVEKNINYKKGKDLISHPKSISLNRVESIDFDVFLESEDLKLDNYNCSAEACDLIFNRDIRSDDLITMSNLPTYKIINKKKLFIGTPNNELFDVVIGSSDTFKIKNRNSIVEKSVVTAINDREDKNIVLVPNEPIIIQTSHPQDSVIGIIKKKDSIIMSLVGEYDKENRITWNPTLSPDNYELIIKGFTGKDSTSYKYSIKQMDGKELGSIELSIKNNSDDYIIEWVHEKNGVVKKLDRNTDKVILENQSPGNYYLNIIKDVNKNGIKDNGKYLDKILPEKSIKSKIITVRPNWSVSESITIDASQFEID